MCRQGGGGGGTELYSHVCGKTTVLLQVEDTEFAKQLVYMYCILYCTVGHWFPLFVVLSFCVYCFANSKLQHKEPLTCMPLNNNSAYSLF